jgi:D-alanine-D-alanine ligase
MGDKPKKVAVLLGGKSTEREISLKTGKQIAIALAGKGYIVREVDAAGPLVADLDAFHPDVVFIALHGKYGEDGTIQGLLEILGYPYTGSGVLSSAVGMDKVMTKKLLVAERISTPDYKVIHRSDLVKKSVAQLAAEAAERLDYPLVVKPSCQGSTIGITIPKNAKELEAAIDDALCYDDFALAEKFIDGMELTVSVLGTEELQTLPIIEIVSDTGFYDYKAKYDLGLSHHIIPARIPPEAATRVNELALRTYRALGCRQFARVDVMLSKDEVPYVLEANTIPGLTPTSLFPDAAKSAGISFEELVAGLVDEAWSLTR